MNDPHKFGTEFGSDHALEQSTPIVSHQDSIEWFEAIPGEQLCIRVHGTQVNGRYAIMENIAAPGTATPICKTFISRTRWVVGLKGGLSCLS